MSDIHITDLRTRVANLETVIEDSLGKPVIKLAASINKKRQAAADAEAIRSAVAASAAKATEDDDDY